VDLGLPPVLSTEKVPVAVHYTSIQAWEQIKLEVSKSLE